MSTQYSFNRYLPDYSNIERKIPEWIGNLKKANPALFNAHSNETALIINASNSTMNWLQRNRQNGQSRYQTYGPFWFAYKKILKEFGFLPETMQYERPELEAVYSGRNPAETVAAAYLFMQMFLHSFFVDTKRLQLDENQPESIDLTDPDMEQWLAEEWLAEEWLAEG